MSLSALDACAFQSEITNPLKLNLNNSYAL